MSNTTTNLGRSYFLPKEISGNPFHLTSKGKSDGEREDAFTQLSNYVNEYRKDFLGYQSMARLTPSSELDQFLKTALNNIGDSFANPELTDPDSPSQLADGYFSLNVKWIERAVLDYFAERWRAGAPRRVKEDAPDDPTMSWQNTYWGYVLSMGSTEGNLMALRSARDYLKGRRLLFDAAGSSSGTRLHYEESEDSQKSEFNPVLLYSQTSHYSVRKLAQMLEFESREIKADKHGRIDPTALLLEAKYILHKERRPLAVHFNYATTWTGALDDIERAVGLLKPELQKAGMDMRTVWHGRHPCERRGFWFHVDGALGAGYGTYGTEVNKDGFLRVRDGEFLLPRFDFELDIQSIVMSGHKWPGAPWPTGIYMTQNRYMLTNDVPAYVGSLDSTLAGSRSGIASIFLWDWLAKKSDEKRAEEVKAQLALARGALNKIKESWDRGATRAPGSLMVVFKKPSDELVRKYGLACNGDKAHLVCMLHVNKEHVDGFIEDLQQLPLARYALDKIRQGWDGDATRAPGSLMVVFKKPSDELVKKYELACNGDKAHLVCKRHVNKEHVNGLVAELQLLWQSQASVSPEAASKPPSASTDLKKLPEPISASPEAASKPPSFDDSPREGY